MIPDLKEINALSARDEIHVPDHSGVKNIMPERKSRNSMQNLEYKFKIKTGRVKMNADLFSI